MALTIAQVLKAEHDRPVKKVPVPEWEGDVYLTTMPSTDYDVFAVKLRLSRDNPGVIRGISHEFVAKCWCDESGKRQTPSQTEINQLGQKDPRVINRLFDEAWAIHDEVGEDETGN